MNYVITAEYDQYAEGIIFGINNQQITNEIELINFIDHNKFELEQSYGIQIELSTTEGLEERKRELERLLPIIIKRVDQLQEDIDTWKEYVNQLKCDQFDLDPDSDDDYTWYLTRDEFYERKANRIDYWEEMIKYYKIQKLICEAKNEIRERIAANIEKYAIQLRVDYDQRISKLNGTHDWNIQMNIEFMVTDEITKRNLKLLTETEYQKNKLLLKDEMDQNLEKLMNKNNKIKNKIEQNLEMIKSYQQEIDEAVEIISEIYNYDNYNVCEREEFRMQNILSDTESENSL
jgi:hypothetical protein